MHLMFNSAIYPPSIVVAVLLLSCTLSTSVTAMNSVNGCSACMSLLQETDRRHDFYPWAVLWTCPTCTKHYHCCDRSCGTRSVTAFASRSQLTRHHRHCHKKPRLDTFVDHADDTHASWEPLDATDDSNLHNIPIDAFEMFANHVPTQRFFVYLQHHSLRGAVQGLVARACHQDATLTASNSPSICDDELSLFFRIARLVFKTGPYQQNLFGDVLSSFERRYPPASNVFNMLPLPTTHKAFVATLTNATNQNSFTSIIPRPPIIVLGARHAYVPVPSLLAYELGLAHATVDPAYNPKFERLVNSRHGQELFHRANAKLIAEANTIDAQIDSYVRYVVLLFMWFDGWDPSGSSKGNRSPVWSGTLTMVFLDMLGNIVAVATYPFAAGPGKAGHDVIFQAILGDVRALQAPLDGPLLHQRWHYSRAAQQMALLYGELFCIWQDQPARRQETNTLGGNSNNHAIFGVSCYVKHLRKPIPACMACRAATIAYLKLGDYSSALRPVCTACTNWRFPKEAGSGLYQNPISETFPTDAIAGKHLNVGGGAVETTMLIEAWGEACAAVIDGRWNDSTTQIYLKTLCVNDATIKAMIHQCRNHVLWTEIGDDPESYDPETRASYRTQYAANPELFAIPEPPSAWFLAPLSLHVETVMHLAGGVQKAVAKFVHRYATSLGHGPALSARLAFPIAMLHKYCRVQFLPLAAYNTDKFGGWVMENFKSLCKLAPWLYHCFEDDALQPPVPFREPTTPRSKWTQKQNIGYLRSRGIATVANMKAADARATVDGLFNQADGPPAAVFHPASTVTPQDMRSLWLGCSTMCKDLMRVEHDQSTRNRTDARVRAFLSEIETLDALLQPARLKPLYLAKYNFPSLLRAVQHLEQFGNIRDLHEGGIEGEAMVKQLRPLVPTGLKDGFATHLLRKSFRDHTLDRLLLNLDHQLDSPIIDLACRHSTIDSESPSDHATEAETLQHEALEGEPDPFLHMRHILAEPEDTPFGESEHCDATGEPSPLLFRRYSSRAIVERYLALGVPISVVITNQEAKQRIGVIVSKCNQWWLLPLSIGRMQVDDELGFAYFQIQLHPPEENMLVQTRRRKGELPIYHIEVLNYATLLPALWLERPFPYALLTMEGEHLNVESNFV